MGLDHGVAKKSVVLVRPVVKHPASMVDNSKWLRWGCEESERSTCGDKFGENVKVGVNGVTKHESVDLQESFTRLASLKQREAFSFYWTPKRTLLSLLLLP